MRRGRPGKPTHSHNSSARPSPSPFRGPSTDPFAILDGGSKPRSSADEISNRFPTLDQFDILHEKGGKFDFEQTVADSKGEDDDLSRRLTNALADDAFVKRPSPERAQASASSVNRKSQPTPLDLTSPVSASRREEPSRQAPLYQPSPQKPNMVSTGTMTSPQVPNVPSPRPSSRPIFRFPPTDQDSRPSSQQWYESEKKKPVQGKEPSPTDQFSKFELHPSRSPDRLSNLSVSARPSLDSTRPSQLEIDDPVASRSKSANSRIRPVSVHAGARFELHQKSEGSRSSVDLSRTQYEDGVALHHAHTDIDRDYDRPNITSDVDYLRAKEVEEVSRKREKRHSGTSKHVKRSSLHTLSLSGTKTLFGGRFGDAFRRFESSHDIRQRSQSPEPKQKQPTTITASEVSEPEDIDDENDDISPEMRRELERRRISHEEKRVASAAAEYRRRVAEKGEGGRTGSDGPRALSIQNRVQSLLGDANKPAPQKTASGYGRFTEETALQAKQTEMRSEQRPVSQQSSIYTSYSGQSPAKEKWENVGSSPVSKQPIGYQSPQRTDSRPVAPPKPKNLRVGTQLEPSRPPTQHSPLVNETPMSASGGDWEASFSRRFPSLSGLEMVETEIEIPKVASLRTKEV